MAFTSFAAQSLFSNIGYMGGSNATFTLGATNSWIAFVFFWPGGDLTKCALLFSSASGSPVVTVQLFNTDPTSATDWVNLSSPVGSAVDSGTIVANTPEIVSGIGQASLPAGIYALRVILKSGTSTVIRRSYNGLDPIGTNHKFPFQVTVTSGGSQTKAQVQGMTLAVGGSTFVPVQGLYPPSVITTLTPYNSGTTPNEWGIWFTNPHPHAVRICGVKFFNPSNTRPDLVICYYTGSLASPNQVFTQTFDADLTGQVTSGGEYLPFAESNWQSLAAGATVGIGIRAGTADNMSLYHWNFVSGYQQIMDCFWGQNVTIFSRSGGTGALTQIDSRTPLILPLYNGSEVPAGSATPRNYTRLRTSL